MIAAITSADNKAFKSLARLLDSRGQKKQEHALAAGARLVRELVRERPGDCRSLIVPERFQPGAFEDILSGFSNAGRLIVLSRALYRQLDTFKTGAPLLELRIPDITPWDGTLKSPGCTLALPFQDPANIGSVIRSAAAFGARQAVLLREAATPFHPKSIRASAGAVFSMEFFRGQALSDILEMPAAGDIVALDMRGRPVGEFTFPERFLLLPGIEGQGLPGNLRSRTVSIPMRGGGVESLNAAVATSIALYCWSAQENPPGCREPAQFGA